MRIPITKPTVTPQEIKAVVKTLKSGYLVQGPITEKLERAFAQLCGTTYAAALNSGTAALHAALYALGIEPGDEIITTPFTFAATANTILMVGAQPVFVDIDEKTYNIDESKIENAITKKTKALLPVNLYGQPANYDSIRRIAKKNNLSIVEDAAQSIGSSFKNRMSGNLGDIGCFSLYATKNIMCGEGGM
ncbi:aminotransferase DegT, partial [Candidatus Roizmanbacteria bacterium CG10_big_fil_rev_8_21_14_0_10_45_7]